MQLIAASLEAPAGLEAMLQELGSGGEHGFMGELEVADGRLSIDAYLRRLVEVASGVNLPQGWVTMTTFWLLNDSGRVVGVSRLRHALNGHLLARGGHIGYYVRHSQRGRGHGHELLARTLEAARGLGLERVLVTVDSHNTRSIRVIEGNGGKLEDERIDKETGEPYRRYWIEL